MWALIKIVLVKINEQDGQYVWKWDKSMQNNLTALLYYTESVCRQQSLKYILQSQ